MLLSRRITRALGDGAQIVVSREWLITFAGQGTGCTVSGHQLTASVDAPESLTALARIEQGRNTNGMFPIFLSKQGRVMGAGNTGSSIELAEAVRQAERMINARAASPSQRADQLAGLAVLQKTAAKLIDQIPDDLFYPSTSKTVTVEPMTLDGGMSGEFELQHEAVCAPDGPWLAKTERRVITRIGDSERHSCDLWTMTSV